MSLRTDMILMQDNIRISNIPKSNQSTNTVPQSSNSSTNRNTQNKKNAANSSSVILDTTAQPNTSRTQVILTSEEEQFKWMSSAPEPAWVRSELLGRVQGSYDNLYVMTEDSKQLLATTNTPVEGNLMIKNGTPSLVAMTSFPFKPQQWHGTFTHLSRDGYHRFRDIVFSVEEQKVMLNAGMTSIHGVHIPPDPNEPLHVGKTMRGNIFDGGEFSEIQYESGRSNTDDFNDKRYIVTSRVPDSYNYNWERYRNDGTVPPEHKGHPQFNRPPSDKFPDFETELAKARYLTGMEPYLDENSAKAFDHFTYWKYKQPNPNNPFYGAFIHIFITRPDLHIFDRTKGGLVIRGDIGNNPDLASLMYTSPECAQSLVGKWQTGAMTDINIFLSNRATGVQIGNDNIDDHSFVEGFTRIKPSFGGRMDNTEGDIDITFNETQDLSVSNTILLWMKYIHATYTGQLSALGDLSELTDSRYETMLSHMHPIWRRLDSLASIYVVATDMTQRNIIFWRKYFGVYPKATPYAGLGTDGSGKASEGMRKITVPFKYTTFRTNNIIDLYAFDRLNDYSLNLDTADYKLNNGSTGSGYQIRNPYATHDHDNISGLPFIAIEQHIQSDLPKYTNTIPTKMYNPQLLFTITDGAFIPRNKTEFRRDFVNRYWSGLSSYAMDRPSDNSYTITEW